MRGDLRRLRDLLAPEERRQWLTLLPVAALSVMLEAAGAATLVTLLGQALTSPEAAGRAAAFAVLLAGVFVVRGGLLYWVASRREHAIARSIAGLTERLLAAYLNAPYAAMLDRHSSQTAQRVTHTVEQTVTMTMVGLFTVAAESLVAVAIAVVLLAATPFAALSAVAAVSALVAAALLITRPRFAAWSTAQRELHQQSMQHLQEALGALAEVKVLGAERVVARKVTDERRTLAHLQRRRRTVAESLRIGIETTIAAVLLLSIVLILWRGTPGAEAVAILGLYAYGALRLVPSANRINAGIGLMRSGRPYLEDLHREWLAFRDLTVPADSAPGVARLDSAIQLEAVSFAYPGAARPALDRVDLTIRRGEFIGVAGPIGSGKSTLVNILLGLLEPASGRVLIDGVDLRTRLGAWRRAVGYVAQRPFLVADTVRRNVAFGVAETDIDDVAVATAIRLAGLERTVARLRSGVDTILAEHGIGLSGGERQLIAIARGLYRAPSVLVLDEPTASLDAAAQAQVAAVLASLRGSVTIVAVSHRLEALRGCDRVVMMRDGRAAEGSFDVLVLAEGAPVEGGTSVAPVEGATSVPPPADRVPR
jgi:ATP-binding cassette subfamily C protein